MNNYYQNYFSSGIIQAKSLVEQLKKLDQAHHESINPISIFGELPSNLLNQNNLVKLFESKFDTKITVIHIQYQSFVQAYIKSYEKEHKIIITQHNPCLNRFYICKELSQMLIYRPDNSTCTSQDVEVLFSCLINGMLDNENPQISADFVAYLIAIEFLLPSAIIPELLKLQGGGFNNNLIAKKMIVPEKIVDFRLSDKGCKMFDNLV